MPEHDTIEVTTGPDAQTVVVAPQSDVDMSRSPSLRAAIREAQAKRPGRLVVDLASVGYMDSSGLATLVEAMRVAKREGTELVLCGMNDKVRAIFEIARLDQFFTIVGSVDDALVA